LLGVGTGSVLRGVRVGVAPAALGGAVFVGDLVLTTVKVSGSVKEKPGSSGSS
jgi:hypothetical protein